MKLSTEIHSLSRLLGSEEAAIRLLAASGFEAFDFSLFSMAPYSYTEKRILTGDHPLQVGDYRAFAKRLRAVGEECGLSCNQSHAPFPSYCPEMIDYLYRAIECTAIAGGAVCVIHPDNYKTVEENAELYGKLLPFAKECGVKIATENVFRLDRVKNEITPTVTSTPEAYLELLHLVNDESFVACVDLGHAELASLNTSATEMLRALGRERIACLHVNDNDKCHDSHVLPFTGAVAWEPIAATLAEIGYRGDITLECGNYVKGFATADDAPACAAQMAAAATRLREMIRTHR